MAARLTGPAFAAALEAHVEVGLREPFVWGLRDCCTFAADWVLAATGVDPMAHWRGRYRTHAGARRAIGPGGLAVAFRHGCEGAGLRDVAGLEDGDVGLIETARGPAAAIRYQGFWVGKTESGLGYAPVALIALGLR